MLEMETNRITEDRMIEKRKDVVRPLEKIVGDGGSFQQAQRAMETFQIALENASKGEDPVPAPMALTNARKTGDEAQAALRKVHGDLEAVIQALEQVANLAKEIEKLKKIADKTLAEQQLFARLKKLREDQDFENALNPTPMKKP